MICSFPRLLVVVVLNDPPMTDFLFNHMSYLFLTISLSLSSTEPSADDSPEKLKSKVHDVWQKVILQIFITDTNSV